MEKTAENIILIALILGLIGIWIYEVFWLMNMYANSDEVNCNWLWCEFKTTFRTIDEKTVINQECYKNNVKVNCSDDFDWIEEDGVVDCSKYNCSKAIEYIKNQSVTYE